MMNIEAKVADYYKARGSAEDLLQTVKESASNPEKLSMDDLAPFDDMHVGGRKATDYLMRLLDYQKGDEILEIGSGMGGPARYIAYHLNVHVTGIDLSPDHEFLARTLSEAIGMEQNTDFITGSALELPFEESSFSGAYMIHVGMNIEDKFRLYSEVFRVLKPGSIFGIYDIMGFQSNLSFPMPWAQTSETSFIKSPEEIRNYLLSNGFKILQDENRKEFALHAFEKMFEKADNGDLNQASLKVRSESFREKVSNLYKHVLSDDCSPQIMICSKA